MLKHFSVIILLQLTLLSSEIFIDQKNKLMWQDNKDVLFVQKPYVIRSNFNYQKYHSSSNDSLFLKYVYFEIKSISKIVGFIQILCASCLL